MIKVLSMGFCLIGISQTIEKCTSFAKRKVDFANFIIKNVCKNILLLIDLVCHEVSRLEKHYLLHCLRFNQSRRGLFGTVAEVLGSDIANLDSVTLCHLLLYGSYNLTLVQNMMIIEATIDYIQKTNRLT